MNNQSFEPEYNEVTVKDLFLKGVYLFKKLKPKWHLIALIALIFSIGYGLKAYYEKKTYDAQLTFMVNESDGGKMGGIGSLLGQFGFGGSGNGEFNLDKICQLATTRRILQVALSRKATVDSNEDYLANHCIRLYEFHEDWNSDPDPILKDFFFTHFNTDSFTIVENLALNIVIGKVNGTKKVAPLFKCSFDEDTGILNMATNSISEIFSVEFTKAVYDELSSFYINKSIERQKFTFDLLKHKTDSLESLMNINQSKILRFEDKSRDLVLRESTAPKLKSQRDLQAASILYGETVKNLAIAEFTLKSATPFFQSIDEPIYPVKSDKPSWIKQAIIGFIIGSFISIIFLSFQIIVKELLEKNN